MAWTQADVTAAEVTRAAADLPLVIGRNWMRYSGASLKWTTNGDHSSSDVSATGFPVACAGDDYDHAQTKPSSAGTERYINLDLGSSAPGVIDCFAIKNHNLGSGGATVQLQIADSADFATRLATLTTIVPADDTRIVDLDLRDGAQVVAQRYSAVRYARVRVTKGSPFTPQIGEVWVGRRRQLFAESNFPFDPLHLESEVQIGESLSGIMQSVARGKNRRLLDFIYTMTDATAISDWETLLRDELDGGRLPFLWIDSPNGAPEDAYWMFPVDARLRGEDTGYGERRFRMVAKEQGPYFLAAGGA